VDEYRELAPDDTVDERVVVLESLRVLADRSAESRCPILPCGWTRVV